MNIMITGANGSLGKELVKLLEQDNKLFLVDFSFSDKKNNISYIETDIRYINLLYQIEDDIDCIIHLAAKVHVKPKNDEEINEFYEINFEATKKLYKYAIEKKIKHFIFISTLSVYGESTKDIVTEDSLCNPLTPYAKSKYLSEEEGLILFNNDKLPITIFRLATMYGHNDRGNYGKLISAVKKGLVPIVGKGKSYKPIVYVKDVANIISKSIFNKYLIGQTYIISENNYMYKDIISTISSIFNPNVKKILVPSFLITIFKLLKIKKSVFGKLITLDSNFQVNNDKLIKILGYNYEYSFEDGLKDSFEYYNNKKGL